MAAITPASVSQENFGSLRVVKASFTTASDTDTWASGINGVFGFFTHHKANPTTQTSVGIAATLSGTTFSFYPAEDGAAFDLYVLVKG